MTLEDTVYKLIFVAGLIVGFPSRNIFNLCCRDTHWGSGDRYFGCIKLSLSASRGLVDKYTD